LPDFCENAATESDKTNCKDQAIIRLVTFKFVEESNNLENAEIIPSNINLCEGIESDSNKDYCKDPMKVLNKNKYFITYEVEERFDLE